ncbi:MAG: DNA primase [Candidatus Kapaibacterium sp.]
MILPEEKIEEIRREADIVEIISEFVDIRRKGREYVGLCPFHNEKTPSFKVSQEKQIYKCFGCGKAGNVFSFMMDYNGMTFLEAAKSLAQRLRIELPSDSTASVKKTNRREAALNAISEASLLYLSTLKNNDGKKAYAYFKKRGFSDSTINDFQLGYAPDSWDYIKSSLMKKGFKEETLLDAGLIIKNEERNSTYDRFRGRAMFAITDFMGRVVGFGARRMTENKDEPKYINSPQTLIYDKSNVLYGLSQAKNSIRNKGYAIMAEGYADVLSLHQAGFDTAVASSGTSLTPGQLKLISRYAKKIYFVYDADTAGQQAAERGLELALGEGFEVRIVTLPEGEDPDSLINNSGPASFKLLLESAASFMDFKFERIKAEGRLDSPQTKADAAREMLKLITAIPDRLQHDFYIQQLSSKFDLSAGQIDALYREKSSFYKSERKKEIIKKSAAVKNESGDNERDMVQELLPEEFLLLHIALQGLDELSSMVERYEMSPERMITPIAQKLFEIILEYSNDDPLKSIMDSEEVNKPDKEILTGIAMHGETPSDSWDKFTNFSISENIDQQMEDAVIRLEITRLEKRRHELIEELKSNDNYDLQIKSLTAIGEIDHSLSNLRNGRINS